MLGELDDLATAPRPHVLGDRHLAVKNAHASPSVNAICVS